MKSIPVDTAALTLCRHIETRPKMVHGTETQARARQADGSEGGPLLWVMDVTVKHDGLSKAEVISVSVPAATDPGFDGESIEFEGLVLRPWENLDKARAEMKHGNTYSAKGVKVKANGGARRTQPTPAVAGAVPAAAS